VKHEKVQKKGAYLLGGVFLRNFYTVFNWDTKSIEFGVNVEAANLASIKSADKAFKSKGKDNESLENIKIFTKSDKNTDKDKDGSHKSHTNEKSLKQQSILEKIDKSV